MTSKRNKNNLIGTVQTGLSWFGMCSVCIVMLLGCILTACNETFDKVLTEYPEQKNPDFQRGKVLWIVIDGASGTAVKQANNSRRTNNIRKMLANSVYTFDGLADTQSKSVDNVKGWRNLMTGINDDDIQKNASSVFALAKQAGYTTALYSPSADTYNIYGKDADKATHTADDAAAVSSLVDELKKDSVADYTVVELDGVMQAGEQNGFFDATGQHAADAVINALSTIDGYIGEVKTALEARPKYSDEKWLVVVTSNYGGSKDNEGESEYEKMDRKVFSMIYNNRFNAKLLQGPAASETPQYKYFTLTYSGSGKTESATVNDPSLFDFTYDPEETDSTKMPGYTVQFMYMDSYNTKDKSFSLVSKARRASPNRNNNDGWAVLCRYQSFKLRYDGKDALPYSHNGTGRLTDGKWHVLTFVFDYKNAVLKTFKDGNLEMKSGKTIVLDRDISTGNAAPLRIGKLLGSKVAAGAFHITNLQVYNVALPDSFIADHYKQAYIDRLGSKYKYWNNLIGYWPCDREEEYNGSVLHDYSKYGSILKGVNSGRSDMTIDNPVWTVGSSSDPNVKPYIEASYYQKVLNTVDLSSQSFQWLGIQIENGWQWEGIARALPYNNK